VRPCKRMCFGTNGHEDFNTDGALLYRVQGKGNALITIHQRLLRATEYNAQKVQLWGRNPVGDKHRVHRIFIRSPESGQIHDIAEAAEQRVEIERIYTGSHWRPMCWNRPAACVPRYTW
jgi:hypothetical protein